MAGRKLILRLILIPRPREREALVDDRPAERSHKLAQPAALRFAELLPTHECELVGAILDPCSRRKTVHRERAIVGEPATLAYTVDGRRAASNVLPVCGRCDRPVRMGTKILSDGRKVRVCKRCGESVDKG